METDALNTLVTGAIWRAEQLEALRIPSAGGAWAEVSYLEEELAKVLPASAPEGRIARRGSLRAALKAGDYVRASALLETYTGEEAAPQSLKAMLRKIVNEHRAATANRAPRREDLDAQLEALVSQMIERGILLNEALREIERRFITRAHEQIPDSSPAAVALGGHRKTLGRKVEERDLTPRPKHRTRASR